MANLGDITKAINSEVVNLSLGSQLMATIYDTKKSIDSPRLRVNTRSGAADFSSFPLIQLVFTGVVSKDVHAALEALSIPNAQMNLTQQAFTLVGSSITGSSGDNITVNFTGQVYNFSDEAPENGWYLLRCTIIILSSTYIIS
jgi:hypothetical protein